MYAYLLYHISISDTGAAGRKSAACQRIPLHCPADTQMDAGKRLWLLHPGDERPNPGSEAAAGSIGATYRKIYRQSLEGGVEETFL